MKKSIVSLLYVCVAIPSCSLLFAMRPDEVLAKWDRQIVTSMSQVFSSIIDTRGIVLEDMPLTFPDTIKTLRIIYKDLRMKLGPNTQTSRAGGWFRDAFVLACGQSALLSALLKKASKQFAAEIRSDNKTSYIELLQELPVSLQYKFVLDINDSAVLLRQSVSEIEADIRAVLQTKTGVWIALDNGSLVKYSLSPFKAVKAISDMQRYTIALAKFQKLLAAASPAAEISMRDIKNNKELWCVELHDKGNEEKVQIIRDLAFMGRDALAVSCEGSPKIFVLSVVEGKIIKILQHRVPIRHLTAYNGNLYAFDEVGGCARWDTVRYDEPVRKLQGPLFNSLAATDLTLALLKINSRKSDIPCIPLWNENLKKYMYFLPNNIVCYEKENKFFVEDLWEGEVKKEIKDKEREMKLVGAGTLPGECPLENENYLLLVKPGGGFMRIFLPTLADYIQLYIRRNALALKESSISGAVGKRALSRSK